MRAKAQGYYRSLQPTSRGSSLEMTSAVNASAVYRAYQARAIHTKDARLSEPHSRKCQQTPPGSARRSSAPYMAGEDAKYPSLGVASRPRGRPTVEPIVDSKVLRETLAELDAAFATHVHASSFLRPGRMLIACAYPAPAHCQAEHTRPGVQSRRRAGPRPGFLALNWSGKWQLAKWSSHTGVERLSGSSTVSDDWKYFGCIFGQRPDVSCHASDATCGNKKICAGQTAVLARHSATRRACTSSFRCSMAQQQTDCDIIFLSGLRAFVEFPSSP